MPAAGLPLSDADHTNIKTIGFTEFLTKDEQTFKHRKGTVEWILVSEAPPAEPVKADLASPEWFTLHLCRFRQLPGEPLHWAIVLAPTNPKYSKQEPCTSCKKFCAASGFMRRTLIFEVCGDPVHMIANWQYSWGPVSLLEDLEDAFELAKIPISKERELKLLVNGIEPPKAQDPREVSENCQGWCVRVLEKMAEDGLVGKEKVGMARGMMQPIFLNV
ncbi:hypothetical protein BS50DRAFT_412865 [Corynespora cassiicola Philippines]|uniref:Uncharacterized protein n=1 Tax=Corynespora cassiicola Philippines TaxID=1448308 RepID=A0A2T2NLP1_CORCC|nr:hypothetical protein BS50DRAFT_412865 [Corynespora cassiicola Philippines]